MSRHRAEARATERWRRDPVTRHHFVFLNPCGCPFGLIEATHSEVDEDGAWDEMYEDDGAGYRAAVRRGVTAVHVDHATYEADFYPKMLGTYRCPHN